MNRGSLCLTYAMELAQKTLYPKATVMAPSSHSVHRFLLVLCFPLRSIHVPAS
jgi:hypothetical protein